MKKNPSPTVIMVFTTVASQADAGRISRLLVRRKVAACASVLPGLRSFYRWEGKMVRGREVLVMLKTTARRYKALEKTLKAIHPYEVPEILAVAIRAGYIPYLEWVAREASD